MSRNPSWWKAIESITYKVEDYWERQIQLSGAMEECSALK